MVPRIRAVVVRCAQIAVVIVLVACDTTGAGVPSAVPTGAAGAAPGAVDPALLEPLTALGPCPSDPVAGATAGGGEVEGLYLPDGATVQSVQRNGPLTNVTGYVTMTPIQLRVHYLDRDDVRVLSTEDEVWESESLMSDGIHRLYVKAQAACELGSRFVAFVTDEQGGAQLPTLPSATPAG